MGKSLTKQQQQIIALVVIFVGGGGFGYWNYLLKPTLAKIQKNQKEYKELVEAVVQNYRKKETVT